MKTYPVIKHPLYDTNASMLEKISVLKLRGYAGSYKEMERIAFLHTHKPCTQKIQSSLLDVAAAVNRAARGFGVFTAQAKKNMSEGKGCVMKGAEYVTNKKPKLQKLETMQTDSELKIVIQR